jgi:hypothetical protein
MRQKAGIKTERAQRMERVLLAVQSGARNWEAMRRATRLNDDHLGMVLTQLFEERLIRTRTVNGERIYLPVYR